MYLTEKELFAQYEALQKSCNAILKQRKEIVEFFNQEGKQRLVFLGSGSSYSLAKSAAMSANLRLQMPACAFAAGDLLLNFENYRELLKDTVLISISRSGSTSEVVKVLERAKDELGTPCVSICAKEKSDIAKIAGLNIELPWAFDASVCQTRCVTNLYTANLLLIGILAQDKSLVENIKKVIAYGETYLENTRGLIHKTVEQYSWDRVVVLADGEMEGIAEEGALAFNEISMLDSHYYHVLDIRHGPMVLVNSRTLAVVALSPSEKEHQIKLIADLKEKGSTVIAFSEQQENIWGADVHIPYPVPCDSAVRGIPFIFVSQALSLFKAIQLGTNPDQPDGLVSWIKL